jgi:anaerobic C4-dicarboxylate transporter DcuA
MATLLILCQLFIVLALIFIGARVGGIGLGIPPLALVAMFPAVNGYFFIPNYPTEVAAINFDTTGTTRIGKYVLNHSFQLSGFITTFVSIGIGYLIITFIY